MVESFDVVIVGAGVSGSMAAISAARNGAKVLVVESAGFPGGSLTVNSVAPMMSFHAGDCQVSTGIAEELIERLVNKGESLGHVVDYSQFTPTYTPFDEESMKYELESMLVESGVHLLYHTQLADVIMNGDHVAHIMVCNKAGLSFIQGKYYIDATGDADLVVRSGNEYSQGRKQDHKGQPMTLMVKITNVDVPRFKQYIRDHLDSFPTIAKDLRILDKAPVLCTSGLINELREAKERGEVSIPREDVLFFESSNKQGEFYFNTTRVLDHDSSDPWSFSDAEIVGRQQAQELRSFLRNHVPGFEHAIMSQTGPVIGSRSSRQLVGAYVLTEQDILNQKKFSDSIAYCGYPIDVHNPDGEGTIHKKLPWGGFYGIPYRCVIPKQTDNLFVTGRCISVTFEAQAAIRTTPTVCAIGQAVGAAASLAIRDAKSVQDIDVAELRLLLHRQGAYMDVNQ